MTIRAWMVVLLLGCTDDDAALRTLDAAGFRDVRLTGFELGCADSDATHTGFDATNGNGKRVHGVVCCGMLFKACTVRF